MNGVPSATHCRRCGYDDPDVHLMSCNCLLHARCFPLGLIIADTPYDRIPYPITSNCATCPICMSPNLMGIRLLPLTFGDLERAVELRQDCVENASTESKGDTHSSSDSSLNPKRRRDDLHPDKNQDIHTHTLDKQQTSSPYLTLSKSGSVASKDQYHDRTGRWSSDEVEYVDHLVERFTRGLLPLPHGIKLNEFLGDMLLCKSSRLTKKMKNAKLSARSFTFQNTIPLPTNEQCVSLSALQHNFLQSVTSDAMRLELKFNITKLWRTHFSNLCIQIGYALLDAREWLASLEELERRASAAEAVVRLARRRRLGLALRQDIGPTSNQGVFIGGIPAYQGDVAPVTASEPTVPTPAVHDVTTGTVETFYSLNDQCNGGGQASTTKPHRRHFSDDFSIVMLEELMDATGEAGSSSCKMSNCGAFLDNIMHYLELHKMPFDHADVWVPSYPPDDKNRDETSSSTLRLFHAGHTTRSDINSDVSSQLREYGAYSTKFSFAPGVGLPGRVYTSGKPAWECNVHEADPARFERAGGAKVYGVVTAVGIPLEAPSAGRIVVALYSTAEIPENPMQLQCFVQEFSKWTPIPKWSLEIELGQCDKLKDEQEAEVVVSQSVIPAEHALTQTLSAFDCFNGQNGAGEGAVIATLIKQPKTHPSSVSMDEDTEQTIATLLGDHMPNSTNNALLQPFMTLRLLLLRSQDRRSEQDNDSIDVIKKSYLGYCENKARSEADIASLLARDWMFLSASAQSQGVPPQQQQHPQQQQQIFYRNMLPPLMMPAPVIPQGDWNSVPSSFAAPIRGAAGVNDASSLLHWQHHHQSVQPETPRTSNNNSNNNNHMHHQEMPISLHASSGMAKLATLVPKSPRE